MRVLFLIDHLNRERGGAENQAFLLLSKMPPGRAVMRLACFDGRAEDFAELAAAGVEMDLLPRPARRVWPLSVLAAAGAIVRTHRIDVVQSFLPTMDILAPFLRIGRPRLRIATSRRCLDEHLSPRHLRMLRGTARLAHAIVANSAAVADSVRRLEGVSGERLRVIPNALPPWPPVGSEERAKSRSLFGVAEGDFVIVYPAHFRNGKGHGYLPELARMLATSVPHARILVAGDTTSDAECRQNSRSLLAAIDEGGLSKTMHCLGLLPAIRPLLAAADATLNLSDREGMSNTLMEGMALGIPVVATAVGGTPELIEDGREGLLVPRGDIRAAAENLARLAFDPVLREGIGSAAREKIARGFSVDRLVESYASLYESLAG